MKVRFQRFFSLILAVMLCGVLVVPARASIWDGVAYNVSTFWDYAVTGTSNWNLRDAIGAYTGGTWAEKYANYVDDMLIRLGTGTVGKSGYVMRLAGSRYTVAEPKYFVEFVPGPPTVLATNCKQMTNLTIYFEGTAPVTGNYLFRLVNSSPVEPDRVVLWEPFVSNSDVPFSMTAGDPFSIQLHFLDWGHGLVRRSVSVAFVVQPYDYSPNGFTGGFGGASSRPGNVNVRDERNIKFGIKNADGTVVVADKIDNLMIEQENKYYNPVTNTYVVANDWNYSYTDRSYNVEGADGDNVSITYGDDVVTMVIEKSDGSKDTYIYSYLIADDVVPPPVAPGPSPEPSPDPGGGGIFDGLLKWLKDIWGAITGLGKTIVDGILNGLGNLFFPSEENVTKLQTVTDEKLPIIGDLKGFGDQLVNTLKNPAQSVDNLRMTTVVNLGNGKGQIAGAAQINLLDMSWYLEYKPLVDNIIVGFAWLVFLWNLYGELPSIIHGGASALHSTSEIRKEADYWRHDE